MARGGRSQPWNVRRRPCAAKGVRSREGPRVPAAACGRYLAGVFGPHTSGVPGLRAALLLVLGLQAGCYRYSFEQRSPRQPGQAITHVARRATYLNGLIGRGVLDTRKYCAAPVRTELRVTAMDVLLSAATLLIYTPHTMYVTCAIDDGPGDLDGGQPTPKW